jgi:orotidine-5'-phosphate decarboxylase
MADGALAVSHAEPFVRARDRLIVALDVPTVDAAEALVNELNGEISFYKIGLHLQLDRDLHRLFGKVIADKKHIFLDFKAFDIPATVAGAVRAASRLGIDFITVIGQQAIVEAAVNARSNGLKILVVTLLTGMNEQDIRRDYGTDMTMSEFIARRAQFAASVGCDGVISSAREVSLIREAVKDRPDFLIVTPGIRPEGVDIDDQKRVATPYEAIRNGADYLVVGRPIIHNRHPLEAARNILRKMELGFEARQPIVPDYAAE